MDREVARRAEALFLELAGAPASVRAARLAEACGEGGEGDGRVREEVLSLLAAHDEAPEFLESPASPRVGLGGVGMVGLEGMGAGGEGVLSVGTRVGAYTLLGVVGSGGMGVVYLAEQERPRRTVALKLIRRGLATASMLRRFEREAELLGRLHHPGIAQIFEAGVAEAEDGRHPYIAMEFVRGRPLLEHAKGTGVQERVELVARVCDAVQHAHQRGVIHRDLKPANILVTDERAVEEGVGSDGVERGDGEATAPVEGEGGGGRGGEPKVLDFGVARAADADLHLTTLRTSVGEIIGTLAYMSPEQVGGDPAEVDTRSDVYALGVILYQLLAGRLPYELSGRSAPEAMRAIREEPPARLSAIDRAFRGDLETIVAKAMEKDRSRRYQSAAELGEDLRRYARGEAVLARQTSSFYLLRKQLSRHRWALRAACAALIGLLGFVVYAAWQARTQAELAGAERQARQEADGARERAEFQRNQAESARARADALGAQLAEELSRARVEVGRLEGSLGRMALAEQTLWAERLANPSSLSAAWALRELYDRLPCIWTRALPEHPSAAAISSDGRVMAVATHAGRMHIFDAATGEVMGAVELGGGGGALSVAASAGAVYAGFRDGRVVRVARGAEDDGRWAREVVDLGGEGERHAGGVRALALIPGGAGGEGAGAGGGRLVSGGEDGVVRVRDVTTGALALAWKAHEEAVTALAISADGKVLFTAPRRADETSPIRAWDAATGEPMGEWKLPHRVYPVSLAHLPPVSAAAPARLLIGDFERWMVVLDTAIGAATTPLERLRGPVTTLRPSRDGRSVLVTAGDTPMIMDAATLAVRFEQGRQRQTLLAAGWTGEDRFAIVDLDGLARGLLASPSPAVRVDQLLPQWTFGVAFDPAGTLLAATGSDATVHVLEAATMRRLGVVQTNSPVSSGRARAVKFLPAREGGEGVRMLVGNSTGEVRILGRSERDSGNEGWETLAVLAGPAAPGAEVYSVDIHPDGRRIAAGHGNGHLAIWDVQTGEVVMTLPRQPRRVEGVAFSPDGALLASGGRPGGVALWDLRTGEEAAMLETSAMPWGVAFTPDGSTLLVSLFSGAVDVFDVASRRRVRTVQAHQRLVPALAVSPDGALVVTGSEDGALKVWDAATFTRLASFEPGIGEIIGAAFDPSSRWLAATSASGAVARIDLRSSDAMVLANEAYAMERFGEALTRGEKAGAGSDRAGER